MNTWWPVIHPCWELCSLRRPSTRLMVVSLRSYNVSTIMTQMFERRFVWAEYNSFNAHKRELQRHHELGCGHSRGHDAHAWPCEIPCAMHAMINKSWSIAHSIGTLNKFLHTFSCTPPHIFLFANILMAIWKPWWLTKKVDWQPHVIYNLCIVRHQSLASRGEWAEVHRVCAAIWRREYWFPFILLVGHLGSWQSMQKSVKYTR